MHEKGLPVWKPLICSFCFLAKLQTDACKGTLLACRVLGMAEVAAKEDHLVMGLNPSVTRDLAFQFAFHIHQAVICFGKAQSFGNAVDMGIYCQSRDIEAF